MEVHMHKLYRQVMTPVPDLMALNTGIDTLMGSGREEIQLGR